jgi:protein-S-isoprenylcysteine O-methyltransferase Ste14
MAKDIVARVARLRVTLGFLFGAVVLWLAQPTPETIIGGSLVAVVGEGLRLYAAGHLEKGREVTKSGPYRFTRHPLYVGSSIIGLGLAIAAASLVVAAIIGLYLGVTLGAAIKTEEAFLRSRFGDEYDRYSEGQAVDAGRSFSWSRAGANREHRAIVGLAVGVTILAMKAAFGV